MNKKIKIALITVAAIIVLALLVHLTANVLIPFIKDMHSGGAY
jgi:hypothetical protein